MNFLFICNTPIVNSQGSGYVINQSIKALQDLGHNVKSVPPDDLIVISRLQNKAKIYRMILGMFYWVYKNRKSVLAYHCIVFYGGESFLAVYYLKKLIGFKGKIILHSNGIESHVDEVESRFKSYIQEDKPWYRFSFKSVFSFAYRNSDAVVLQSNYDKDYALHEMKLNSEKVFVINPPLTKDFFIPNIERYSRLDIISFCGSWLKRKGTDSIQSAIPIFLRNNRNFIFRIIGVGTKFNVEKFFPSDICEQIEVIPFVSIKADLAKLYLQSKIFLFPSFCESFGLVVAEAMACGCAVITGPTGIAVDLIHKKDAIVLPLPDSDSVVFSLNSLIQDENLRVTIGKNAVIKAQNLTEHSFKENWSKVLEKLF